jgi:hypothetical protein
MVQKVHMKRALSQIHLLGQAKSVLQVRILAE